MDRCFSKLEVLLTVKGYYKTFCFIYVDNTSQLSQSLGAVINYPYIMEHKIRVISYVDHKWYIDPPIEDIRSHWKLWVLAKQPLVKLDWDQVDYQWTNPFTSNNSWEDMCCQLDGMCYQLHFNIGVSKVLL